MTHLRWPTLALAALAGCTAPEPPASDAASSDACAPHAPVAPSPLPWSGTSATYDDEVDDLDRLVDTLEARVATNPDSWYYRQQAAGALQTRARLTGRYADYGAADAHLAAALTDEDAAPWGVLAAQQYSLHRLSGLSETIDRLAGGFPADTLREADVAARRGNLDLSQGRYAEGMARLEHAIALHPGPGNLASLAVAHWHTGDFATAEQLFVDAASRYHSPAAEPRAWFHLNLGLLDLDRGRWDEALSHYRDAEKELSGSWLIEEHIAEILVNIGHHEAAEALYLDVIERTDAPEFMDALSGLLADQGRDEEAADWLAAARERWEGLLATFPEAAYGHALAHYLDSGDAPLRALELAEANHALRPDGEAKILLASAYLGADRPEDAVAPITEALDSAWESAALHAVAAEVFDAMGDPERAAAERAAALAIDPHILD